VPVALLKRNKLSASQTGDWLGASAAFLSEELPEALGAVRFLLTRGELLTSQDFITVVTSKAIPMPGGSLVRNSSFVNYAVALHTALSILLLVAGHAHDFHVTWDKALVSDWLLANLTTKALLMPLLSLVLIFLHSSTEDIAAAVASCGKVVVMAVGTVKFLVLRGEGLIYQ